MSDFDGAPCVQHVVEQMEVNGVVVVISRCCVRCGAPYLPNKPSRPAAFS